MGKIAGRQPVPVRRADAERNIAAILDAGTRLLSADPTVSVAAIAKAAGVGRVTLYGHFPSREALVDAVLNHAVDVADAVLADDFIETAPASEAMIRLLRSSWEVLDRHRRLFLAADRVLTTERIREHPRPATATGPAAYRTGAARRRLPH
jgi:AcrR family transcriptional regulator